MSFFDWLGQQVQRRDDVGAFARYAVADRVFPRAEWRLCRFLSRYEGMPLQRAGAKVAHREWRKSRKKHQHTLTCPAYGNYQPPYETCDCGAES